MCNSGFSSFVFKLLSMWSQIQFTRDPGAVRRKQSLPKMIQTFSKEVVFYLPTWAIQELKGTQYIIHT